MPELPTRKGWSAAALAKGMGTLVSAFAEKATPQDMLRLAELAMEAREMEKRAELAKDVIATNRDLAMRAMDLRDKVLSTVVERRMDRTDKALDLLISKLETASSPEQISAVATAIAQVATTDQFKDAAEMVAAIKADRVELEF